MEALAKLHKSEAERQRSKYPPQHAATLVNTNCSRQQATGVFRWNYIRLQVGGGICWLQVDYGGLFLDYRWNFVRLQLGSGVLFLQFGDETRRVHITHELTSMETLHALIVHMFPQKLTMGALRSPSTAILIKDEARNVFYELEDPRDVHDRCVIKIYCREPPLRDAPYNTPHHGHHGHITNGDLRVSVLECSFFYI
uniref:Zgc:114120 n=1 Tax=Astyanax mexicanus TaxID=7994 RepID=A0A8B9H9F0_ASTMX